VTVGETEQESFFVGRFTSMDPALGNADDPFSFHGYSYVANNPVNLRDPFGRQRCPEQYWECMSEAAFELEDCIDGCMRIYAIGIAGTAVGIGYGIGVIGEFVGFVKGVGAGSAAFIGLDVLVDLCVKGCKSIYERNISKCEALWW